MIDDRKNFGWDYLNKDYSSDNSDLNQDDNWSCKNEDGSESYYGSDGSWGYKNADGSGTFYDSDGSWGYRNADGSSTYYGADGSYGFRNTDGSSTYYGADGTYEHKDSDDDFGKSDDYCSSDYCSNSSNNNFDDSTGDISLGGIVLGAALVGFAGLFALAFKSDDNSDGSDQDIEIKRFSERQKSEKEKKNQKKDIERTLGKPTNMVDSQQDKETNNQGDRSLLKGILVYLLMIVLISSIGFGYLAFSELIPIQFNKDELIDKDYKIVIEKLNDSGIYNIYCNVESDLKLSEESQEGLVTDISLSNGRKFKLGSRISKKTQVIITYHTLKKIYPPIDSEDYKDLSVDDLVSRFKAKGFSKVNVVVIYDVILGIITKDGEIKSVEINGEENFTTFTSYREDAEVTITYHTLRKNKPKN